MPETFPLQSVALSRRLAILWPVIRRVTCGLCFVGLLLLPTLMSAQTPPGEPNVGEAAPFGADDLAKPPAPLAAEVNPPVIPAINDPITAENVSEKPDVGHLIPTDPIELFLAGGFSMWPLLLASIISLWFVLERLVVLRRRRVIPRAFVDRFIQHLEQGKLNAETALRLCEENQSPIADIFAHGVRKWGKPSVEVEQAIIDGGERQISQLRTHLRVIHGVYNVAPMLGLLGTVVGMVVSFNELARGGDADRMQRLAGGVGVALITTATGLFVAIPSLVLYLYLSGRIDGLIIEMDLLSQKVANLISSEGLANRSKMNMAKATPTTTQALPGVPAPKPKAVGT
jgi:biopolymer transport protein ExbB